MRPERTAVAVSEPGVALLFTRESRRDVALGVTGGHEDERNDVEIGRAELDQLGHGLAQRRRRQLDESAADRAARIRPLFDVTDQVAEACDARWIACAMADDEQRPGDAHALPRAARRTSGVA